MFKILWFGRQPSGLILQNSLGLKLPGGLYRPRYRSDNYPIYPADSPQDKLVKLSLTILSFMANYDLACKI